MIVLQATMLKHPEALKTFFTTEMWERYGFYVIQSLLALVLALHFGWSDHQIYTLVSAFTGLTYLSPIVGGWIADNWIGQKKAIYLGGFFLFSSYVSLALFESDTYLKMALAAIALGTGLLKPNISSLLGHAYPENSPARESGFTIFYMGITTGIILGTTLPSFIQQYFGWALTFGSAALGMVMALLTFYYGVKRHKIRDYQEKKLPPLSDTWLKVVLSLLSIWLGCYYVLLNPWFGMGVFFFVLVLSVYFVVNSAKKEAPHQAKQTIVIGMLCLISVFYWAFYFQMFLSLTLFILRLVQPTVLGITFPPPYYVCIESIGMLLFGYFISKQTSQSSKIQTAIRAGNKFFIAMLTMALSYSLIVLSILCYKNNTVISPFFIIPAYLLISISELLLSPVGLSIVTVLADRKRVSTLMGIFFVSLSLGAYLSGILAQATNINPNWVDTALIKAHYLQGFSILMSILCVTVFISFMINRAIKKIMANS